MAKSSAAPATNPLPLVVTDSNCPNDVHTIGIAELEANGFAGYTIADLNNDIEGGLEAAVANAHRIVRAVNAHQALYEALSALYEDSKEFHDTEFDPKSGAHTKCGWCMARAALALADAAQEGEAE